MTGRQAVGRPPERDDIVVALASRRNFDQFHPARSPIALGLDPGAGATLVLVLKILEIALLPRALYQAEAIGRFGGEARYLQRDGVRQLPEDLLARFRGDHETVRIVHFGAVIVEAAAVGLIEQKHRGERRDADDAHVGARKYRHLRVHQRCHAGLNGEAVRAGGRVAFEQGVDHDGGGVGGRLFHPEMREPREFLARGFGRVDGEPARGEPVEQVLGDRPKIARTLKHQKFVPDLLGIDLATDAKARERQRYFAAEQRRTDLEHGRRRHQIPRHAVLHRRDRHGDRLSIVTGSQQLEPERHVLRAPDAGVGVEMNAAVLLRAQLIEPRGQRAALRRIGLFRAPLGVGQQGVEREFVGDRFVVHGRCGRRGWLAMMPDRAVSVHGERGDCEHPE